MRRVDRRFLAEEEAKCCDCPTMFIGLDENGREVTEVVHMVTCNDPKQWELLEQQQQRLRRRE